MLPIILASSSKYRSQLLEKSGIIFKIHAPDIDEAAQPNEGPEELVKRLSLHKAKALTENYPNHLIIGSDQVACLQTQILTKPGNFANALAQLQACQGHSVIFYTGLCLYNSQTQNQQLACVTTEVRFRQLSDQQLTNYLHREQPYDCAGSFKVEGLGITLFESINSSDPNALIGLPVIELISMLTTDGIDLLDH